MYLHQVCTIILLCTLVIKVCEYLKRSSSGSVLCSCSCVCVCGCRARESGIRNLGIHQRIITDQHARDATKTRHTPTGRDTREEDAERGGGGGTGTEAEQEVMLSILPYVNKLRAIFLYLISLISLEHSAFPSLRC
jgi:hypothetical protein